MTPKRTDEVNIHELTVDDVLVTKPRPDVELTIYGIGVGSDGPVWIEARVDRGPNVSIYHYEVAEITDDGENFVAESLSPPSEPAQDAIETIGGIIKAR